MGATISAGLAYGIEKSSKNRLPPLNGELQLACLDDVATIYYDKYGFPHVYCKTNKDGFRIQGYLIAQHRGFQLEITVSFIQSFVSILMYI